MLRRLEINFQEKPFVSHPFPLLPLPLAPPLSPRRFFQVPITIVFTKADRRKKKHAGGKPPAENALAFRERLGEVYDEPPPWLLTSAVTGMSRHAETQ